MTPAWRFDLFYRAIFSRPADLIYGSFDESRHKIPRIAIPPEWPRFLGLDFGGVNTAGIFFAQERDAYHKPTGRLFAYREYRAGDRSAAEHCYHLMKGDKLNPLEPRIPHLRGRIEVGRAVAPRVRRWRHGERRARGGHPDPRARQAGGAEYRGRHQPRLRGVRLESDPRVR